jgi:pimeloyl-ACP methyl ester carboxylesterase
MAHVELSDTRIDYEDRGSGRPVVCVHGYLSAGDLWDDLVPLLVGRGYRVLTPTWPLGAHTHPLPESSDRSPVAHAGRIAAFLEALDLRDVILVGNDTGGALSQLVVAHHPERVGALVLTNCDAFENFPPSMFKPLRLIARSRLVFSATARSVQIGFIRRAPTGFGLLAHADFDDRAARWVRPIVEDPRVREDTRLLTLGMHPAPLLAATDRLRRFDRPVLLAWGTDDRLFPIRDAERLADTFPDARVELVPDSRTFVMVDQPRRLADLVAAFATVTT